MNLRPFNSAKKYPMLEDEKLIGERKIYSTNIDWSPTSTEE